MLLSSFQAIWILATLTAGPAGDGSLGAEPPESRIYGGEPVASCGWPSAAFMSDAASSCTGTLIHPQIVLTAAHCIDGGTAAKIKFGETAIAARVLSDTEYCRPSPTWTGSTGTGQDYGYCKLTNPVLTVPIIPVAAGCEQGAIRTGARIYHVGFGVDENGDSGVKKQLDTVIDNVSANNEIISGDSGRVICNGDSGGPTFVWLDPAQGGDGSWRVAGIHSWAQGADPDMPNCNFQAGSVAVWQAIDWIEQDSGVDITPCHDNDQWAPTFMCQGMPTEPWVGGGAYSSGCEPGAPIGFSEMCGPALDAQDDSVPPVVAITTPDEGASFELDGGTAAVTIVVEATDEGWGMEAIDLTIANVTEGGDQMDTRTIWDPWTWDANLPPGGYEVTAIGRDNAGNESEPAVVRFGVGQDAPDPGGTGTGTGSDGGTGTGDDGATGGSGPGPGDGSGTSPGGGSSDSGCGCGVGGSAPLGAAFLVLAVGTLRRRR